MAVERCRPRDVRADYEELRAQATGQARPSPGDWLCCSDEVCGGEWKPGRFFRRVKFGKVPVPREGAMPGTHPAASTELAMLVVQMVLSAVRS